MTNKPIDPDIDVPAEAYDAAEQLLAEMEEEKERTFTLQEVKEIARLAWMSAANAHRIYPENKHTFVDYWNDYGQNNLTNLV